MPFDRTIAYLRHVGLTVDARLIVLDIAERAPRPSSAKEAAMARELRRLAAMLGSQPAAMGAVESEIAALGKDLAEIPAGAVAKVKAYRKELRAAAAEVDAALAQLTNGGETESPLSGSQASSAPALAPSLGTAQASPDGAAAVGHETTAAAGNTERAPRPSSEDERASRPSSPDHADAPPPKTDAPAPEVFVRAPAALRDETPAPPAPAPRPEHEVVARVIPPGGHP